MKLTPKIDWFPSGECIQKMEELRFLKVHERNDSSLLLIEHSSILPCRPWSSQVHQWVESKNFIDLKQQFAMWNFSIQKLYQCIHICQIFWYGIVYFVKSDWMIYSIFSFFLSQTHFHLSSFCRNLCSFMFYDSSWKML